MGLWLQQVHHSLESVSWLVSAHYAEHVPDLLVLLFRGSFLHLRKEIPQVDEEQLGAQHVKISEDGEDPCRVNFDM